MEVLQAILLGIIEGLTEFLPVSSTGHLIVAEDVLNYKDTAEIFTVVIQSGAILAVIWFYRRDLWKKTVGLMQRDQKATIFWRNWILATLPAGLIGFALQDTISRYAVSWVVALALIIGGLIILLIEKYHKPPLAKSAKIDSISLTQAIKIGFYQVLALIPGVSRSGATIMGGLLSGLDRVTATAFSFYLSIPILVGAGAYQLAKGHDELNTVEGGAAALIVGSVAAFITAFAAIAWLLRYVASNDFRSFAYYRIIFGVIILTVLAI